MKTLPALLILAVLSGQEPKADKIGKDKPPIVAKKFLTELPKRKSAAIVELSTYTAGPQKMESTYEGVLRKDFVAVKGSAEVYAKGAQMLVNTGGRFDPPESLEGQEAGPALTFKNPSLILDELLRVAASASFGGDETVDGKECRVVDFVADAAALKKALRDLGDRLSKTVGRQFAQGGVQLIDFKTAWDERASVATYRVCVGMADLNIYRVEFVLRPKMKPGAFPKEIPFPAEFDQRWDIRFTKWDEDVPFEIPGPVKVKLGVK